MTIVMRGLGLVPGGGGGITVAEVVSAGLGVTISTGELTVSLEEPSLSAGIGSATLSAVYLETTQTVALPTNTLTAEIDSSIQI